MNMVCAKLNQGIDSFVRVSNFLRRKEINIKEINMQVKDNNDVQLNITFQEDCSIENVLNYISKLQDVYEVKVSA